MTEKANSIDEYISGFPENTQKLLDQVRATIKKVAPDAEETISYAMPAFKLDGILLYFAAHKNHIGFYPTGSGIAEFQGEFTGYKYSKGAVQLPIDKPLPLELIARIVRFRVLENQMKKIGKRKK